MKWFDQGSARASCWFLPFLLLESLSGASAVRAEAKDTGLVQGSWILVALYNETDGKKSEPFGP